MSDQDRAECAEQSADRIAELVARLVWLEGEVNSGDTENAQLKAELAEVERERDNLNISARLMAERVEELETMLGDIDRLNVDLREEKNRRIGMGNALARRTDELAEAIAQRDAHAKELYAAGKELAEARGHCQPRVDACVWTDDEEGVWSSSCGHLWIINEGSPSENSMKFCHACGCKLIETPTEGGEG